MISSDKLQEIMCDKELTDSLERASFIHGFRTAERIYTKGDEMNLIRDIYNWQKAARPNPTDEQRSVAIGVHYEEVAEMLQSTGDNEEAGLVGILADRYKKQKPLNVASAKFADRRALLDALCDQIVTAVGVAQCFGFDIEGALAEVNRSNYSKWENGKPIFNEHGKIIKGKNFTPPVLDDFL